MHRPMKPLKMIQPPSWIAAADKMAKAKKISRSEWLYNVAVAAMPEEIAATVDARTPEGRPKNVKPTKEANP